MTSAAVLAGELLLITVQCKSLSSSTKLPERFLDPVQVVEKTLSMVIHLELQRNCSDAIGLCHIIEYAAELVQSDIDDDTLLLVAGRT